MVVIVDPCGCLGDDPAYFIATLSIQIRVPQGNCPPLFPRVCHHRLHAFDSLCPGWS